MRHAGWAAAALLLLAHAPPAAAQPAPAVSLTGQVAHPASLDLAALMRLSATRVAVSFDTMHGAEHATYTGALLWTVLQQAGLVDAPGPRTRLQHSFLARGRDGYAVVLALGEIDPAFEGKAVLVAYARDGRPMTGLRLVVPGDRKGGRSVKDLVSIDVR